LTEPCLVFYHAPQRSLHRWWYHQSCSYCLDSHVKPAELIGLGCRCHAEHQQFVPIQPYVCCKDCNRPQFFIQLELVKPHVQI
jgi:hypothetical protein